MFAKIVDELNLDAIEGRILRDRAQVGIASLDDALALLAALRAERAESARLREGLNYAINREHLEYK